MTAITNLQSKLNRLGCTPPLVLDGVLGPLTKGALTMFKSKLLYADSDNADGTPGPITFAFMDVCLAFQLQPLAS